MEINLQLMASIYGIMANHTGDCKIWFLTQDCNPRLIVDQRAALSSQNGL